MTHAVLLGLGVDTQGLGEQLLRGLAVLGAAALGGFLGGLILQVSSRMMTAQKAPPSLVNVARVLGAVTLGALAAFLLFHGMGGSGGGPGGLGPGLGGGKDNNGDKKDQVVDKDTGTKKDADRKDATAKEGPALTVEVLGDSRVMGEHFYRVEGETGLKNLKEVRELLPERRKKQDFKVLEIVLYEDSPAADKPIVTDLVELARESNLTPSIKTPNGKAP